VEYAVVRPGAGLVAFVVLFLVNQWLYRALYGKRKGADAPEPIER
jgi:hypothetical protein